MPFLRGWTHPPAQDRGHTVGFLILSNDRWNQSMLSLGVVPIRTKVEPFDQPFSVLLADGTWVVASRLVSSDESDPSLALLGPPNGALPAPLLEQVEDKLRDFLQLPALWGPAPRVIGPLGDPSAYAVWGQIYKAGPPIKGERKRRIVVSPNSWNAVSGLATLVRTTTSFGRYGPEFPKVQAGAARACCGETTTMALTSVVLDRYQRPIPHTATMRDMKAVARGLMTAYELGDSLRRIGVTP